MSEADSGATANGLAEILRDDPGVKDCYAAADALDAAQARIRELESQVEKLVAFAGSFHITVVDNFYKDVTLVLERPHSLAMRLQNDSSHSWVFADLETRRKAALTSSARPTQQGESK